jgi:hypothetical protein
MANQLNQILHEPPVFFEINNEDGIDKNEGVQPISGEWQRYFTNQRQAFNQFFPVSTIQDSNGISQVSIPTVTPLTTAQRDNVQNPSNGMFIYNTTTEKFNFYENGAWVEKSNV